MTPATASGQGVSRGTAPAGAAGGLGRYAAVLAVAVLLATVAIGVLAGPGQATVPAGSFNTSNDTTAPEVGNLTKVGYTQVELTITDDEDVAEGTIDGADLFVSDGTIANVSTTEDGSNATVTVELETRIDVDRLGVAVADGATISDEAGNQLDASGDVWRYVTGMDGVAPSIQLYEVTNGSGDRVKVRLRTSEDLAETYVRLYGPADRWLTLTNFTKPSGISEYVADVEPTATGTYRVTVVNVTDHHNNTWESGRAGEATVDVVPPTAVAGIDVAASEGRTVAFDANRSSDDTAIRNLTWGFGDGTNSTAWQPVHAFEPGNYTVRLTVTDTFGNVGTDRLVLNLTSGNVSTALLGDAGGAASISAPGEASALVSLPRVTAGEPVEIARDSGEPLAASGAISLDALTVTLATNTTAGLAVEATDPAGVRDVVATGAGDPFGGLTVVHDVPDADVDSVRFSFGVATSALSDRGVEPANLSLYRYHAGEWTAVPTTHLEEADGHHRYRATSPGLSRFAIAPATADDDGDATTATTTPSATPTPTADVRIDGASLNRTEVTVGEPVRVNATVTNSGDADATFTAGLTVDGTLVETRAVSAAGGTTRTVAFVYRPTENGTLSLAVNGTVAGALEVGEGGGGLFAVLGFLPLDLFGALVTYLGGAITALFLLLKAAALYLDY